jgi:(1->4)-alpha-D-glucan 1-alpha-D-glucosylmutase
MYVIWKTLCLRKQWPEVFQQGEYRPLTIEGARADQVVAFIRKNEHASVLVVVPHLIGNLLADNNLPPTGSSVWGDTQVLLPSGSMSKNYQNAFTGEAQDVPQSDSKISVSELLAHFPVALCLLGASSFR